MLHMLQELDINNIRNMQKSERQTLVC